MGTNWNFNPNSNIFIQENALENAVCDIASILSWPQYVNEWICHIWSQSNGFNQKNRWKPKHVTNILTIWWLDKEMDMTIPISYSNSLGGKQYDLDAILILSQYIPMFLSLKTYFVSLYTPSSGLSKGINGASS